MQDKLYLIHYENKNYGDTYEEYIAPTQAQAREMFRAEHEEQILGVYIIIDDITIEDAYTQAPNPVMSLQDIKHSLNTILAYHNKNLTNYQYDSLISVSANIERWIRKLGM